MLAVSLGNRVEMSPLVASRGTGARQINRANPRGLKLNVVEPNLALSCPASARHDSAVLHRPTSPGPGGNIVKADPVDDSRPSGWTSIDEANSATIVTARAFSRSCLFFLFFSFFLLKNKDCGAPGGGVGLSRSVREQAVPRQAYALQVTKVRIASSPWIVA